MIESTLPTDRKIKKSIIMLQTTQPFYGYLGMNLKIHEIKHPDVPTMGVDHDFNIYYNKEWVDKEIPDFEHLTGIICHEILHVALNHIGRTNLRLQHISNIAQDMVINIAVVNSDMKLVQGEKYINVDKYTNTAWVTIPFQKVGKILVRDINNKAWERVYDEIIGQIEKKGADPGKVEGDMDGSNQRFIIDSHLHDAFNKLSQSEKAEVMENMKQVLTDALTTAKMAGKIPGGMERYVNKLLEPSIPWQSVLRRIMKPHFDPNDWTYRKPHRKSYHHGIYLPSVKGESIVVYAMIDTSGSIDQESYNEFASEIYGMMKTFPQSTIFLSYCDTQIRKEYVLKGMELQKLLTFKPAGGGGTDLEKGLDEIMEKKKNVEAVIVLTDGETSCNRRLHHYPFEVIWVISKDGMTKSQAEKNFKYGKVIKIGPK